MHMNRVGRVVKEWTSLKWLFILYDSLISIPNKSNIKKNEISPKIYWSIFECGSKKLPYEAKAKASDEISSGTLFKKCIYHTPIKF